MQTVLPYSVVGTIFDYSSWLCVGVTNEVSRQARFRSGIMTALIVLWWFLKCIIWCRSYCISATAEEASQNGNSAHSSQNGGTSAPHSLVNQAMAIMPMSAVGAGSVPGPTTNLNIGMDYWNATASQSIPAIHGKVPSAPVAGGMVTAGSRDIVQSQMWIQVSLFVLLIFTLISNFNLACDRLILYAAL